MSKRLSKRQRTIPGLSEVQALVALREAVRQFAADYGQDLGRLYADWNAVVKALRRADRAAGRRAKA